MTTATLDSPTDSSTDSPTMGETPPSSILDATDVSEVRPPQIFTELKRGVLGQDRALRFVAVAIFKHTTGKVPGNLLMIGNSGTGKTTIMNNIQRLYHDVPAYRAFRAVTILNANLLVDAERLEFRPDRLMASVEQRARSLAGPKPTPAALKESMERATICIDEIDKMATVLAGKPNPLGVVLQQGLLTLMEGERIAYQTHAWVDGQEKPVTLDIDTKGMMFLCGGAFESLYDQVYDRVTRPGSGKKLRKQTIRTADGQVRIDTVFSLADMLEARDLFDFGMVPQFLARFDKTVVLSDLSIPVLRQILLLSFDSPFVRAREFFATLDVDLELEDLAAALIAEQAHRENRLGARALRPIFGEMINPLEFDPWQNEALEPKPEGGHRLCLTADMARAAIAALS